MSKRITSIDLRNCRAYFGQYDALKLPSGENLLIYGENGSGKSSLYKALNNYFLSSNVPTTTYVKNRYQTVDEGEINIEFSEFDLTGQLQAASEVRYIFGSAASTNNVPFIQTAARVKGFLDYTDLLKVYLHSEPRPNLFELIVLSLLGNHIPLSSGGNFEFYRKWSDLQADLTVNAFNRNARCHKNALRELPTFEVHLRATLDLVFVDLNRLLSEYFTDLNIQLDYVLQPLNFSHNGWKWEWFTAADLRLDVIKDGVSIAGDYSDFLNEARLSAIAICLYLASLLQNPTAIDLRMLYLDDVFIGLDAGNRIPILNILRNEFSGYQIFISTYDRHWFELAKRHFDIHSTGKWSNIEIYVGQDSVGALTISKPIIVKGESHYEKAVQYLHNRTKPDYPAAANYFRKALEELIPFYIPKYELADAEKIQLADHKLSSLLYRTKSFIEKTGNSNAEISQVIGLLHILLHPLSHHEISSPIYKTELIILETTFINLRNRLIAMDIASNYKCIGEPSIKLKLSFTLDAATNYHMYYELALKSPVVVQHNPGGSPIMLDTKCYTERCHGINNGAVIPPVKPNKSNPIFNYTSFQHAVDTIHQGIQSFTGVHFAIPANYLDIIEYHDGNNWVPFAATIVW